MVTSYLRAPASALRLAALLGSITLTFATEAWAAPVRVYAAGSLVAALKDLIAASGLPAEAVAAPTFGPAGLLRQRIENGEQADLYLSADLTGPRLLAEAGKAKAVVPFARNTLCVLARADLGLTPDNLLDRLLKPDLRLATSTPGADPGGDYAQAIFERAEAVHPGSKAVLEKKALKLLGSPNAMVPVAGRSPSATVFLGNNADALLYYCSGQGGTMKEAPGLTLVRLPSNLSVPATYAMALITENPDAMRLALFLADGACGWGSCSVVGMARRQFGSGHPRKRGREVASVRDLDLNVRLGRPGLPRRREPRSPNSRYRYIRRCIAAGSGGSGIDRRSGGG